MERKKQNLILPTYNGFKISRSSLNIVHVEKKEKNQKFFSKSVDDSPKNNQKTRLDKLSKYSKISQKSNVNQKDTRPKSCGTALDKKLRVNFMLKKSEFSTKLF